MKNRLWKLSVAVVAVIMSATACTKGYGSQKTESQNYEETNTYTEEDNTEASLQNQEMQTSEKEYISDEDIDIAYSNPDLYSGKYIRISGKVFGEPEFEEEDVYFQMYGDPVNLKKNTIVKAKKPNFDIREGTYVYIEGEMAGAQEYQNAFGGTLSAMVINAESISESSYVEIMSPTLKEFQVDSTIEQYGYSITLEKVECSETETRLYLKVSNNGSEKFSVYSFDSNIIQGNTQYEEQQNYEADYPEVQTDLLVGAETYGIITFPPIDFNSEFQVYIEGASKNWEENFKPFIYNIAAEGSEGFTDSGEDSGGNQDIASANLNTVTYYMEQEDSGLRLSDTMTLTANGDRVERIFEVIEVDISSFEDDTKGQLQSVYDEMVGQYNSVEGVECTGEASDTSYTMKINIDATGNAVRELSDMGLLEVSGDANGISLEATRESLESGGYIKVEQ